MSVYDISLQAMTFTDGDQALRLIPEIVIPINPHQCMCASMSQIANIIRFPNQLPLLNVGISCSPRPDCIGVRCSTTISNVGNYISDVTIDPCGETVRVVVLDSHNATQVDQMFNDSGSYPFAIPLGLTTAQARLDIGMVHYNYSMDLSVSFESSVRLHLVICTSCDLESNAVERGEGIWCILFSLGGIC
jgi:hypothetical protein